MTKLFARAAAFTVVLLLTTLAAASESAKDTPTPGLGHDYIVPPEHPRGAQPMQPLVEPPDASTVSYTAFNGQSYALVQYNGKYVAFLIQPASLNLGRYTVAQLRLFIDHLDVLYSHFLDLMGSEPPGSTPLLHIAFVPTCGGGCGYVGYKGIELAPEMLDPAHGEYPDGSPYIYPIHELTHNFDLFSSYIMYGPDVAHAWTDFMNLYVSVFNQEGGQTPGGTSEYPTPFLQAYIDRFFTPYLTFPGFSWATCVRDNACNPGDAMAQHAQGGMALRIAQLHGPAGVRAAIQYLRDAIVARGLDPSTMDVLTKNDLLLESLAHGEQANLSCYVDLWNWPISASLRSALQTSFGSNGNCADQDGDGYSVARGDCDDQHTTVHPGASEIGNGADDDCNGIVDDVLVQESGQFGQTVATATPIPFPARITGANLNSSDSDHFRLTLSSAGTIRFMLKSIDVFQGWLFLNTQNNSGWLQYEYVGGPGTVSMDANLASGPWTFSVEENAVSHPGNYQVLTYSVRPWPSSLTAPAPLPPSGGTVTLRTPALPADLQGRAGLSARFWVEGSGWVGTQPLDGSGAASLAYVLPTTLSRCVQSYRVQFLFGGVPVSPTSNPAFFNTPNGTSCDDGNGCTTGDACSSGACVGAPGVAPGNVGSMAIAKSGVTASFQWAPVAGSNVYDVLRGQVGAFPVGSSPATETCLADDIAGTTTSDGGSPSLGAGFWYLVRGENACGAGSWGSQASHGVPTVQRTSATCP